MSDILDQIRAIKPQYKDIPDEKLVPLLHQRYTPDVPIGEIYKNVGIDDPNADGDATRGFKDTFRQLPQLGYGLLAGAGAAAENVLGEGGISTGIKNAGLKGYDQASNDMAQNAKESDSLTYSWDKAKEGNFGALVDWLQYGIGYAGGQGIQMLATAGVGSAVGKAALGGVAKEVAKKMVTKEIARLGEENLAKNLSAEELAKIATSNVASKIGETAAIGGAAFGMEGGEIGGDIVSQANKEGRVLTGNDLAKAFGATLGSGALEFVGDKFGLDVITGRSGLFKIGDSIPGWKGKAARGLLAGSAAAPAEAGTEYGQTLLEEYGKGNDPYSEASRQQAFDAAGLGALGGAAMGGAGGLISSHLPNDQKKDDGLKKIAEAGSVDEAIAGASEAISAPLQIPELIFDKSGTSYNKVDLLRNFMAQGANEQEAHDYINRIINTPTEAVPADLSAYRALQERDARQAGLLGLGGDQEAAAERYAIQNEQHTKGDQFDDSIPLEGGKQEPYSPSWDDIDAANSLTQETKQLTEKQIEARRRLNALRTQKTDQTQAETLPTERIPAAESPVSPIFTHTLSDGTPVTQVDGNVYRDANGNEYEDDYAEQIDTGSHPDSASQAGDRAGVAATESGVNQPSQVSATGESTPVGDGGLPNGQQPQNGELNVSDNSGSGAKVNPGAAGLYPGAGSGDTNPTGSTGSADGRPVDGGLGGNTGRLSGGNHTDHSVNRGALDGKSQDQTTKKATAAQAVIGQGNPEPIHTFTGADVETFVTPNKDGKRFNVTTRDIGSGEMLPETRIYSSVVDAVKDAKKIANIKDQPNVLDIGKSKQYHSYLKALKEAIADNSLKDKPGLIEQIQADERISDDEAQALDSIIFEYKNKATKTNQANTEKTIEQGTSIQKQLDEARHELASQGMVQNANTAKRVRDLEYQLAEEKYPGIAKNVANQGDIASAVGRAIDLETPANWRGDYPKEAQIKNAIYRAIKNHGWTEESAKNATDNIFKDYVLKGADPAKSKQEKLAPGTRINGDDQAKSPDAEKIAKADQDIADALSELGDIFGKSFRMNITPEQEQKLMPVLTKLMDAAFRKGFYKFKDAARFVMNTIRAGLGDDVADQVNLQHLQGAYIGMSGKYAGQGADGFAEVGSVNSIAEIVAPPKEEKPDQKEQPAEKDTDAAFKKFLSFNKLPDGSMTYAEALASIKLKMDEYKAFIDCMRG